MNIFDYVVSIIIPMYNAEKFISKCLQSIIDQSYSNLEIIVINDGSKDRSAEIAKKFSLNDSRIKVYDYPNGGVSIARNRGLSNATGDYIMFVDSDDWLETSAVYDSLKHAVESDSDIVVFGFFHAEKNRKIKHSYNMDNISPTEKFVEDVLWDRDPSYLWNKLYKRTLWDNIEFPENTNFEDLIVLIDVIASAKKITYLDKNLYNYNYSNVNSITNMVSARNKYGRFVGWKKRQEIAEKKGITQLYKSAREWAICSAGAAYGLHLADNSLNEAQVKLIKDYCLKEEQNGDITKVKFKYRLLFWGVNHCDVLCYLYGKPRLLIDSLSKLK